MRQTFARRVVAALAMAGAAFASSIPAAQAGNRDFTLANRLPWTTVTVEVRPAGSQGWSRDLLGSAGRAQRGLEGRFHLTPRRCGRRLAGGVPRVGAADAEELEELETQGLISWSEGGEQWTPTMRGLLLGINLPAYQPTEFLLDLEDEADSLIVHG